MNEAVAGLVTVASALPPAETVDRLQREILGKGLTIFAKVDHSGGATAAGLPLRFTQLLVFGSPKGGTPLMQARQTIGIDLPLRMLVWQDERAGVFVSHDDPAWLVARHGVTERADTVEALSRLLASLAASVARP